MERDRRALAGDNALCSWEGHLTLTVALSTPRALHPGVQMGTDKFNAGNSSRSILSRFTLLWPTWLVRRLNLLLDVGRILRSTALSC